MKKILLRDVVIRHPHVIAPEGPSRPKGGILVNRHSFNNLWGLIRRSDSCLLWNRGQLHTWLFFFPLPLSFLKHAKKASLWLVNGKTTSKLYMANDMLLEMVPRSFLIFVSVPSSITNPNGWSLISKLMLTRLVASRKGHGILNEVGSFELALKSLHDHIKNNDARVGVKMASQRLKTLDNSIERLVAGLDDLIRQLIKSIRTLKAEKTPGRAELRIISFDFTFVDSIRLLGISEKNKANQNQKKLVQTTCKESYALVRERKRGELSDGPWLMDMCMECYSKKDENRTPSTVEATNYMAQMHGKRGKLSEGSQDLPAENDILAQVVGKKNMVVFECMG
ncbi:hypothetical protein RJ640_025058 [Escallonia rubra]|uniref:Uncharacterized protein n=1 Tax=Escallonia rubra TaxID=112253 RepID=A0AA88QRE1_9ASTE|nr:hypothetical protein RJ640_025058 [Escallonia rubra]